MKCRELETERDGVFDKILELQKQTSIECLRHEEKLEDAYRNIKTMHERNCQLERELQAAKLMDRRVQTEVEQSLAECRAKITIYEA